MKPNCYECRWRGNIPSDAHSKCCHPYNRHLFTPMAELCAMFASAGIVYIPPVVDKRLKIKANSTGIKNGWFHYPFNFDPVWLENCKGFEKFKDKDIRVINKKAWAETCEQPYFCEECPERFKCFTERK